MGAHLAITGRDRGRTEGAAEEIRAAGGGQVEVFVADLSSQSEARRLAEEVLQRLPRIDVLVNNVGGTGTPGTSPLTGSSAPHQRNDPMKLGVHLVNLTRPDGRGRFPMRHSRTDRTVSLLATRRTSDVPRAGSG
jgi:NAD(P)-dependent dehydrogenase (short-subunit alcohol dehydrogenase family)